MLHSRLNDPVADGSAHVAIVSGTGALRRAQSDISQIRDAMKGGDRRGAADTLRHLGGSAEYGPLFPPEFVEATARALETDDWSAVGEAFRDRRFIGPSGVFVLVGDYTARRGGLGIVEPTVVVGRVLPIQAMPDPGASIARHFGQVPEHVPTVLPVEMLATTGNVGGEEGEAFVVPDGWNFPRSEYGPALNDMREQARRFAHSGLKVLPAVFEAETAHRIMALVEDPELSTQVRHFEYATHDVGHSVGVGLHRKLGGDLLRIPYTRGIEEWRSDGVAFFLARELLGDHAAANIVLSNIATLFGVDAHRGGGIELDTDVVSALHTFGSLIDSGLMVVDDAGKLAITDLSDAGLLQLTELMAARAVALTRRELRLESPGGVASLYASLGDSPALRALFELVVRKPARGIYASLK